LRYTETFPEKVENERSLRGYPYVFLGKVQKNAKDV